MSPDHFLTISQSGEGIFRAKGYKFLAVATRVDDPQEVSADLDARRVAHPRASPFCYAYRIGQTSDVWRADDDGEPNNAAGRPILGQIDSAVLTNGLVVAIRYFGGAKLGIPRTYRSLPRGFLVLLRTTLASGIL